MDKIILTNAIMPDKTWDDVSIFVPVGNDIMLSVCKIENDQWVHCSIDCKVTIPRNLICRNQQKTIILNDYKSSYRNFKFLEIVNVTLLRTKIQL